MLIANVGPGSGGPIQREPPPGYYGFGDPSLQGAAPGPNGAVTGEAEDPQFSGMPRGGSAREFNRERLLLLPENYNAAQSYELVVGLHGFGDSAERFAEVWPEALGLGGSIRLYPQAPYRLRRGGRNSWSWLSREGGRAEIDAALAYIAEEVAAVRRDYNVDPARIYIYGMSQGGAMTYLYAQEHPQELAGCAVFAGAWPVELVDLTKLAALKATPWLIMQQRDDPLLDSAEHFAVTRAEFAKSGFSRAIFLEYPADGHLIIREQAEDFRDWRGSLRAQSTDPAGGDVQKFSDPSAVPEPLAAELLKVIPAAGFGRDATLFAPMLETFVTRFADQEELLASTIYAIGSLRVQGAEEQLIREAANLERRHATRAIAAGALLKLGTPRAVELLAGLTQTAQVSFVFPDSQAATAGIREGDLLLTYGGKEVRSLGNLERLKEQYSEGEGVELVLLRDEREIELTMKNGMFGVLLEDSVR